MAELIIVSLSEPYCDPNNPNLISDDRFLVALGLGIICQLVQCLNIPLDYVLPLLNLRDLDGNIQDVGFYFRVGYNF